MCICIEKERAREGTERQGDSQSGSNPARLERKLSLPGLPGLPLFLYLVHPPFGRVASSQKEKKKKKKYPFRFVCVFLSLSDREIVSSKSNDSASSNPVSSLDLDLISFPNLFFFDLNLFLSCGICPNLSISPSLERGN